MWGPGSGSSQSVRGAHKEKGDGGASNSDMDASSYLLFFLSMLGVARCENGGEREERDETAHQSRGILYIPVDSGKVRRKMQY